jgi:hypothetical protein
MGTTTAGLPLRAGEHYERCPACATVYRSKRRTRFRCPKCHKLAYALPVPDGAGYTRRSVEGDERVHRIHLRRAQEGEAADPGDDHAAIFLEDPSAEPPAAAAPPSPAPGPAAPSQARPGRLSRAWRGSLGELLRRG